MSRDTRKSQKSKPQPKAEDAVEETQSTTTSDRGDVAAAGDHQGSSEPAR